jgi:hypothetical protein
MKKLLSLFLFTALLAGAMPMPRAQAGAWNLAPKSDGQGGPGPPFLI